MKKVLLMGFLLVLFAAQASAQLSQCTVTATVYSGTGAVSSGVRIVVSRVVKNGVTISQFPVTYTTNASGVATITLPRSSTAYVYAPIYGLDRNGSAGVPLSVPNSATANLEDLAILATVFTTLGDTLAASTNGVPVRIPGNTSITLKLFGQVGNGSTSNLPGWFTLAGSGSLTITSDNTAKTATFSYAPSASDLLTALGSQSANTILAGPTTGSAATPTWRALVAADIPNLASIYQPLDSDLTAIAALSPSNDDIIQRKAGAWTNRTIAQLKTDLNYATVATSGSASDLSAGTLAAARGGAGTVSGLLKANGSGVVSAAVANTDYLSGSSPAVLTGNGSAIFSAGPNGATNPTVLVDTTNGGLTIGKSFASGAARVLNFQTQDMHFPVEQFAGMSDFGTGQIDNNWSIQFNRNGVSALHPRWGENIENFFVTGGGQRLIEKNWDYTSIDGLTSYRPFNFNVDIDTHDAEMFWRLGTFRIASRAGSDYHLEVLTGTLPSVAVRGRFFVDGLSNTYNNPLISVSGNPGTSSFAVFSPSSIASGSAAFAVNLPTTSGFAYDTFVVQGTANGGDLQFQQKNNGTGGSRLLLIGGSSGDAFARFYTSTDWVIGNDRSDSGAFVISNGDTPGTSNRLRITTAGAVSIPGALTVGSCSGCGYTGTVTTGTIPYVSATNTVGDSPIIRTAAETVRVGTGLVLTGALAGDLNYFGIRNASLADTFAATGFTQTSSGDTFVNAASGRSLYLRIGNGNYFVMSASGGYVFQNGNVKATDGDLAATTSTKGLILKSPDGTCYRFTVANGGALSAGASVTCP